MKVRNGTNMLLAGLAAGGALALVAPAQQRQVNGAGATLFVDFFRFPACTNDFIDVDGDGIFGGIDTDGDGIPDSADDLARQSPVLWSTSWWIFQYRSVGSVEGFTEFLEFQACGDLPESVPSERGIINRNDFAITGVPQSIAGTSFCTDDTDADGIPNASGTPICPTRIDFGNTDVPSLWALRAPSETGPAWNRKPGQSGYGANPFPTRGSDANGCTQTGGDTRLPAFGRDCDGDGVPEFFFNLNVANPDLRTIFDTPIALSPVAVCANRGTGLQNIGYTDMQYNLVTGRLPTGENLFGQTRDVGSGTRNLNHNTFGVDPSWGNGDNVGRRINTTTRTLLGPCHQVAQCGGSSITESALQNNRLAFGYTGLFGPSRAIADALAGNYEILNVIKDIDGDGDGLIDGTTPVRPTLQTCIANSNPNTGYQIQAIQTINTIGDPNANRDPSDPLYNPTNPPMADQNTADWLNNIVSSIDAFNGNPASAANAQMPGDLLARKFLLTSAADALPVATNPTNFVPNSNLNSVLQSWILANSDIVLENTPAFGSVNPAGKVPVRQSNPDFDGDGVTDSYNDGSVTGTYTYKGRDGVLYPLNGGLRLSERNRVQADFNRDGQRNWLDIAGMVQAVGLVLDANPANDFDYEFPAAYPEGNRGQQNFDVIVVHVVGDVNGDGNFNAEDLRYFADGLALDPVTRRLNRAEGFTRVDNAWTTGLPGRPAGNFFNTSIVDACGNSRPYAAGASRFDVFGSVVGPQRGAVPTGFDGVVNEADYCYIWQNIGAWSNLDAAARIDLSCDMNGDLVVNAADAEALIESAWGRCLGDLDCNGSVDIGDLATLLANFGRTSGVSYSTGDLDCNGLVDLNDLVLLLARFGGIFPGCL